MRAAVGHGRWAAYRRALLYSRWLDRGGRVRSETLASRVRAHRERLRASCFESSTTWKIPLACGTDRQRGLWCCHKTAPYLSPTRRAGPAVPAVAPVAGTGVEASAAAAAQRAASAAPRTPAPHRVHAGRERACSPAKAAASPRARHTSSARGSVRGACTRYEQARPRTVAARPECKKRARTLQRAAGQSIALQVKTCTTAPRHHVCTCRK